MRETLQQRVEALSRLWALLRQRDYGRLRALLEPLPTSRLLAVPDLAYLLAVALDRLGESGAAMALLRKLEDAIDETGNPDLFRKRHNHEAMIWIRRGELPRARALLVVLLQSAERADDHFAIGVACQNMAVLAQIRCEWSEAVALHERAKASFHRLGLKRAIGDVHQNLSTLYRELGRLEEAQTHSEHALRLYRHGAGEEEIAAVELGRALLCTARGDHRLAATTAARALQRYGRAGSGRDVAEAHRVLGIVAAARGDLPRCREYLELALPTARATANPLLEAEVLEEIAVLERLEGDSPASRSAADAAARVYLGIGADARAERMRARLAARAPGAPMQSKKMK